MNPKPINSILKEHVYSLIENADKRAIKDFSINYETLALDLDKLACLDILYFEDKRIDKLIKCHSCPFYIDENLFYDSLLTRYANRAFLLEVDDSVDFTEAVFLIKYKRLLSNKIYKLESSLPFCNFETFLETSFIPFIYGVDFNLYHKQIEIDKIKTWQLETLMFVVGYDCDRIIKAIIAHCDTLESPIDFVIEELKKINSISKMESTSGKKIKQKLYYLVGFGNKEINILDETLLLENLLVSQSLVFNLKPILPKNFKASKVKIKSIKSQFAGNEYSIFYTISKVSFWLNLVIENKSIFVPVANPNLSEIFEELKKEAFSDSVIIQNKIKAVVGKKGLSEEQKRKYLKDQFEIYRQKVNKYKQKDFFKQTKSECGVELKDSFIIKSFFKNDLQNQSENIHDTIVIRQVSFFILEYHKKIFGDTKIDLPDKIEVYLEITLLLTQIIFTKVLYDKLIKIQSDLFDNYFDNWLPLQVYYLNNKVAIKELFNESLNYLRNILDDADPTNKILFLHSRLKDMRHRESIILERWTMGDTLTLQDFTFSTSFKEFLIIEVDFINGIKEVTQMPILLSQSKVTKALPLPSDPVIILSEAKTVFLLQLLEDLSITSNGISILSARKKGAIRGIVQALLENNIVPQLSIESLCNFIAQKIGLDLKSKLDESFISKDFLKKATSYIKNNNPNQF